MALAAGLAIGAVTITPAIAGGLFTKHKAKNLFYTKAASDARFDTKAAADARFLTPGAGDSRYLPRSAISQIQIGTDSFQSATAGATVNRFTGATNLHGIAPNTFFNAPITMPSVLQGRPTRIDSMVLCYAASATAKLDNVILDKTTSVTAPGTDTTLVADDTDRTDTTCRTYAPATPAAIGPNDMIQLVVKGNFSAASDIAVSRLTVNLSD
jgi:hypothetical protein